VLLLAFLLFGQQPVKMKHHRVFYFTHEYYLRSRRQKIIDSIAIERRKLRSNIEATVNEFVRKIPNLRNLFKKLNNDILGEIKLSLT
jgi:hypothetical protein